MQRKSSSRIDRAMACGSVGQSGVQPPSRVTRAIRMRVKRTIEEATKVGSPSLPQSSPADDATHGEGSHGGKACQGLSPSLNKEDLQRVEEVREAPAEFPSYQRFTSF